MDAPTTDVAIVRPFAAELVEGLANGSTEARKAWLGVIVYKIVVEPNIYSRTSASGAGTGVNSDEKSGA